MRTPQRKFVVEFKSGRRQQRAGTKSIWGDTDLKAFVRKAEDDAPHLFGPNETLGSSDDDGSKSPEPMNLRYASAAERDSDSACTMLQAADQEEEVAPKQHEDYLVVPDTVGQAKVIHTARQPRDPSTAKPRSRARRAAAPAIDGKDRNNGGPSARSLTAGVAVSLQELAVLDLENKRLKGMLAELLRAQNVQIKRMLERFDAG